MVTIIKIAQGVSVSDKTVVGKNILIVSVKMHMYNIQNRPENCLKKYGAQTYQKDFS